MLKNKKAIELSLTVVVVAAILLITAVVLLSIFYSLIGKESKQAHGIIGDYDNDHILDLVDKCPCNPGLSEFGGCASKAKLDLYNENPSNIDTSCIRKDKEEENKAEETKKQ
ncbi:hypothetical protein KY366_01225 [Candidatus Woesearchaeota archaeon]|nr:hypothetical protein [Candidatus Woesearchaeota archaeon]